MASPDVAPILAKDFIPLMLDYDRQPGAKEIEKRFVATGQGLPWFAFIDGDGTAAITSTGPKGNVGHPYQPHEVEHFKTMLTKVKRRLTDADIAFLITSLVEANRKK